MGDLSFHVRTFVPGCADGPEMEAREALLKARDYAVSLITSRRELVSMDHAIMARDVASYFVFRDEPIQTLEVVVRYCRCLVQCALIADLLELEWEATGCSSAAKNSALLGSRYWPRRGKKSSTNCRCAMQPEQKQHRRYSRHITRGPRWKALRMQALERDGWACVDCGRHTRLECDHIKPVRTHPELAYVLSNLAIRCGPCHSHKTRIEMGLAPLNPKRHEWREFLRNEANHRTKGERKC